MNVYAEHTHVGKNVMPVRSHKGKNNLGGSNMCLQIVGSYALVVRIERESEKRPVRTKVAHGTSTVTTTSLFPKPDSLQHEHFSGRKKIY